MDLFTDFPGTNLNDLNLDWIVEKIVELDKRISELEEKNNV